MTSPLRTDLYELNMAASYLLRGMTAPATFSLYVRDLPSTRGFLVAAGIERCLDWLEDLRFEPEDLDYLRVLGFTAPECEALATVRFSGDVWAVPEGRMIVANEPLVEISAPIAEAQLVETYLLNQITFETNVTTKAARCRIAAGDEIDLVEFGLRRAQGTEAGDLATRASAIAGFSATSNVWAAREFGLRAAGTMAHSYVVAFPSEIEAFRAFAHDHPDRATFLVDTYDTLSGVANAIAVIKEADLGKGAAVRIDSGDLAALAARARTMLDRAGLPSVRIMVSGGLDDIEIESLARSAVPVDAIGVGTRIVVAADAPYLDSVYKLVEYDGRAVAKLSEDKPSLPGAKQVFRAAGFRDTLGLREESPPEGSEPLLRHLMAGGARLSPRPSQSDAIAAAHGAWLADRSELPAGLERLADPEHRLPTLSPALASKTAQVHEQLRHQELDNSQLQL